MLPITPARRRPAAFRSTVRRGLAAALVAGLAAGVVTAAAAPAAAAVASYTSGPFTVGDSGPSNPFPVTVTVPAGTGTLRSLTLQLNDPQHLHPTDMSFSLRSPSGVEVRIGCNDGRTSFSDGSTCQPLSPFYGVDPGGVWQLLPRDGAGYGDDPNTRYGGFTLTLDTLLAAPAVTAQPQSATRVAGTPVTFTSAATGEPRPSAQWQVDTGTGFTPAPGASTGASYTVTPTYAQSGSRYRVVWTNSQGQATSSTATLTVTPRGPAVTVEPASTGVDSGGTAQLSSAATGDPAPTVQWERAEPGTAAFAPVPGATSPDLSVPGVRLADDGAQYRAVWTNLGGITTTAAATLTVNLLPPTITQNPSDSAVASGDAVTLVAAADSEVAATVQWQEAAPGGPFADIVGATATELTFAASFDRDLHRFRAVFSNPAGATPTAEATLRVAPEAPSVTSDPADVTAAEGAPVTFSASATGDPVAAVRWQVSTDEGVTFTDVPGATATTYTIPATDRSQHLALYRAVFTNPGGEATTTAATLTVQHAPEVVTQPTDVTTPSGGGATFTADASGTPTPTVQWQASTDGGTTFADLDGETSTTLEVTDLVVADSGVAVRAVFANALGTATTTAALITVTPAAPVLTTDLADQTVVAGATVTLSAAAAGDPAPTVQWRRSTDGGATFVDVAGATQSTLTFATTAADSGNRYVAVYTNEAGSVTTRTAVLTVVVPTPAVVLASAAAQLVVTGASSGLAGLAAVLLVAGGGALLTIAHRRRTAG
ncbi:hypothetical protein ICW40_15730 [Actinotalea ferrariae]|uniref:immunoglobulin domain-containing protein n=1 Tax=Actinotalea ferrariae TaxID=1386098 RepID=UPI001C8B208F|nr:immunoglobulin domain-containing protein [Actinotalea ferrariae]MBX9246248.1 hypothetical protein [Actinotalea ferrariae]